MISKHVNIEEVLRHERLKDAEAQKHIMDAVNALLQKEALAEMEIDKELKNEPCNVENISLASLNPELIYTHDQIKDICIKYRLRFLDTKYFKSDFPYEAIAKIKALQKQQGLEFNSFKIIAPSTLFNLEDVNDKDPLLFLNLGNGLYYFIHKWGNDLAWHRRLLAWPIAEPFNALISIASTLAVLVYCLPESWFLNPSNVPDISPFRIFLFFYLLLASCGLTVLFGLMMHKNFSESEWNSQYFN